MPLLLRVGHYFVISCYKAHVKFASRRYIDNVFLNILHQALSITICCPLFKCINVIPYFMRCLTNETAPSYTSLPKNYHHYTRTLLYIYSFGSSPLYRVPLTVNGSSRYLLLSTVFITFLYDTADR